ncbi:Uncharacterised protein [uncultured archaeon]|nr:Uncharacterised protein [uncultured archaeon]
MEKVTVIEAIDEIKDIPLAKLIAIKFWYVLGLFTVIYLAVLAYDLVFGLDLASRYSALIVAAISISVTGLDLVLLWWRGIPSPAVLAMVLWVSPIYVLYKFFKHSELLNINSTYLTERIKQYWAYLPLKTAHLSG